MAFLSKLCRATAQAELRQGALHSMIYRFSSKIPGNPVLPVGRSKCCGYEMAVGLGVSRFSHIADEPKEKEERESVEMEF
jgi:hypothetical protein